MSSPKYMMITVAKCAQSRLADAVSNMDGLANDVKAEAGAVTTRHGVISTGNHTGQIIWCCQTNSNWSLNRQ